MLSVTDLNLVYNINSQFIKQYMNNPNSNQINRFCEKIQIIIFKKREETTKLDYVHVDHTLGDTNVLHLSFTDRMQYTNRCI